MDLISYCGVFCEGCSSFQAKRCKGCGSQDHNQPRISKWKCKIRNCCLDHSIRNCAECSEFPCTLRKRIEKLYIQSYQIDLQENVRQIKEVGFSGWMQQQYDRYQCQKCGGIISPYTKKCYSCQE